MSHEPADSIGCLIFVIALLLLIVGVATLDDAIHFVSHWLQVHSS